MLRLLTALSMCATLSACVHDSPDSRLDDEKGLDPRDVAAMLKLDCSQRREEVQVARDEAQSDFDRLASYRLAVKAFTGAAERIEAAFTKEPDLLYLPEGDALRLRLQRCQAQAKTFVDEQRKYEQVAQFKPIPAEPASKADAVAARAAPEPVQKMKAAKKLKKKTAVAKRKKAGRPTAVLAAVSR